MGKQSDIKDWKFCAIFFMHNTGLENKKYFLIQMLRLKICISSLNRLIWN